MISCLRSHALAHTRSVRSGGGPAATVIDRANVGADVPIDGDAAGASLARVAAVSAPMAVQVERLTQNATRTTKASKNVEPHRETPSPRPLSRYS
jgi:hypothetical protein